jgi:hypothetical protein
LPSHGRPTNISRVPRRPLSTLLLAGLLLAPACVCPAEAELLVARPDFASPEAAGRSFLAAVAEDDATAEYRCLSEALKREWGATLDAWMIGRVEARGEIGDGLLRRAMSLDYLGAEWTEDGVLTRWGTGARVRLGLVFVPQHYFDLLDEQGPRAGELLGGAPADYLESEGRTLRLEIPDALPRRFGGFDGVTRFELGTEWKLRRLVALDS